MWRWRFLKFPPLLKCARGGNLDRMSHVIEEGEQDSLVLKDKDENGHLYELVNPHSNEMVVLDWKGHVYAWSHYVDGLYYLCESHRLSFVDTTINRNACMKLVESLNTQPTSAACIAFGYILFLVHNLDMARHYVAEALNLDPTCTHATNLLLMIEARLKGSNDEDVTSSPEAKRVQAAEKQLSRPRAKSSDRDSYHTLNSKLKINPSQALSEEIMLHIFSYLSVAELGRAANVCKSWWRMASDYSLWKAQYLNNFFDDSGYGNSDYKMLFKDIHTVKRHWRIGECVETPLHLHNSPILCLQFDDSKLITGSIDKTLKIFDTKKYQCTHTFTFDTPTLCLQFNPFYLACGTTGCVRVWDTETLSMLRAIHHPHLGGDVAALSLFRNFLAASIDSKVFLWNLDGIQADGWMVEQNEIVGHNGTINCLQFNDMHTLLSAGEDNVVRVWDIHSNRIVHTLSGHKSAIKSFYSDGQFVASGSVDGFLRFHDLRLKRSLQTVKAKGGGVTCMQFNDNHILTGHASSVITHWDIRYTKWDQEILNAHKGLVSCLGFDRTKMISGSHDSTVRLWDFSSGFHRNKLEREDSVHFSHFKRVGTNTQSKVCNIL